MFLDYIYTEKKIKLDNLEDNWTLYNLAHKFNNSGNIQSKVFVGSFANNVASRFTILSLLAK